MQVTITNNKGIVAEKIEGGRFVFGADGVVEENGVKNEVRVDQTASFAYAMHSGHSEEELQTALERLRIACQGDNSRALMRMLVDMDNKGFIQIQDVKPGELYEELDRSFRLPKISKGALRESYRLMG